MQVITDVAPYELMKLRLLNVGHQALACFGYLGGYQYVHEAMADDDLRAYMDHEGTPSLPELPGTDLEAYKVTLIDRFSNPEIRDTCARFCVDASDRIPKWLVPVIRENLGTARPGRGSAAGKQAARHCLNQKGKQLPPDGGRPRRGVIGTAVGLLPRTQPARPRRGRCRRQTCPACCAEPGSLLRVLRVSCVRQLSSPRARDAVVRAS